MYSMLCVTWYKSHAAHGVPVMYSMLCVVQITCSTWSACHVQHVVYKSHAAHGALVMYSMLCATWYEGTAQLLSLIELKSHLF